MARKTRELPAVTRAALLRTAQATKAAARAKFEMWAADHTGEVDVDMSSYDGVHKPVDVVYVACGHTGKPSPNNLVRGPQCRKCADIRQGKGARLSPEEMLSRFYETHGQTYDYTQAEFLHTKAPVEIICEKHGSFFQSPEKHILGRGCPTCGARASQAENAIASWLERVGCKVERRSRQVIPPKEVDIWLPEHNLAVEYHGLYWHTSDRVENIHRKKWEAAQEAGVRLVQVFEDEWLDTSEVVRQRLLVLIGQSDMTPARKCAITPITWDSAKEKLQLWHTQGAGQRPQEAIALSFEGEVVATATFGRRRAGAMAGGGGGWEVLRYASKGRVVGGFGKLLAEFRRRYPGQRLVSYCDLRYGDGRMYAATGFTLEGVTEPDYWWVPRGEVRRVPRYQTQKHKLAAHPVLGKHFDPKLTEAEICEAAGWKRIHGVGHQKWGLTT